MSLKICENKLRNSTFNWELKKENSCVFVSYLAMLLKGDGNSYKSFWLSTAINLCLFYSMQVFINQYCGYPHLSIVLICILPLLSKVACTENQFSSRAHMALESEHQKPFSHWYSSAAAYSVGHCSKLTLSFLIELLFLLGTMTWL